jgi:hypothetical protein
MSQVLHSNETSAAIGMDDDAIVPSSAAAPPATATAATTLDDYRNFHGMFCAPGTAKRCIDSFTGCILFLPSSSAQKNLNVLSMYDYRHPRRNSSTPSSLSAPVPSPWSWYWWLSLRKYLHRLTVQTYYGLVLLTLTGASTMLGQTKFVTCEETSASEANATIDEEKAYDASVAGDLVVDAKIWRYLLDSSSSASSSASVDATARTTTNNNSNTKLTLKRRFEYDFWNGFFRVIMLHVQGEEDGRLHLVEVFRCESAFLSRWYATIQQSLYRWSGREQEV